MHTRTMLACDQTSAAAARHFVSNILSTGDFADSCVEDAVLLTSEVVTNAVVHAKCDQVELVVVADHPMARVEVYETDPSPPVALDSDVLSIDGRGVRIIDALAEAWGVNQLCDGKCVWFEVRS